MKKAFALFLTIMLFVAILPCTAIGDPPSPSGLVKAEFSIRNGIKWYMSEEACLKKLDEEGLKYESVYDLLMENGGTFYPYEKGQHEVWVYKADDVSLGKNTENVLLIMNGTKKTGLFVITYFINPNDNKDESYYVRAKELKQQLEKKYGEFSVEDNWNKKKSKKVGEHVFDFWKDLDDGTNIFGHVVKEESGLRLAIEYRSRDYKEIEESLADGSYYVTTPYGL